MSAIRVMHFGLGPIGAAVARQMAERPGFKIVGAIDIDPAKVGRDVGDVVGLPRPARRRRCRADAAKALQAAKPDVVVLCTSSSVQEGLPQIETILKTKTPIVSTTEELSYPGLHACPAGAADSRAGRRRPRWRVLATGVNPGLRDGRAADRADGGLRARRPRHRQPRAGRAHPPAAVSSRRSAPA